jgi:outer membrane immunogenic protein
MGLAGIAALVVGTPAVAADMALKAPPMAEPEVNSWAGWYVGVNGGWGWANPQWIFSGDQFFNTAPGQGFTNSLNGGIVGGQIGLNVVASGPWIVGLEFTGDWANLSQTLVGPVSPAFPFDSFTTKFQDLETVTVRVGYAPSNWLVYIKGGFAAGDIAFSGISGAPVAGVVFSNNQRIFGMTGGAGIEYMWTPHIILGVEYDFVGTFGTGVSTFGNCTAATCTGFTGTPVNAGSMNAFSVQNIIGRVSYKF